mgnify:CR=1 FL=1
MSLNFKIKRLLPGFTLLLLASFSLVADSLQRIDVTITTHLGDEQRFSQGDAISFLLSLDKAAHIYLYYQTGEQQVLQLLPNQWQKNHYEAGLFIPFPAPEAQFNFTILPPFGEDKLWIFASDAAAIELPTASSINGLQGINLSIDQIRQKIKNQSRSGFGESSLMIMTIGGI